MSTEAAPNPYDELPYTGSAYPRTHPDHLATLATLLGLTPPAVETCRVLDLGCGRGGNIVPMAAGLPEGRFVGIDLAERQIEQAREMAQLLGITNIQLEARDFMDVGPELGEFDYILCQGVYSWVPAPVQDKILEICSKHLAPNGIVALIHNTLPAAAVHDMVRGMMQRHDELLRSRPVEERVREARAFVELVAAASESQRTPHALLMRSFRDGLRRMEDAQVYHIYLEASNSSMYFLDFCQKLAGHGLEYLCETELHRMSTHAFPAPVQEALGRISPTVLQREQNLDFVRPRPFRDSLLGHQGLKPDYELRAGQMTRFRFSSPLRALSSRPDLRPGVAEAFGGTGKERLTTSDPLAKAALVLLERCWPESVPFGDLLKKARQLLGIPADAPGRAADTESLSKALLALYSCHGEAVVRLSLKPGSCVGSVSARPVACPHARTMARAGGPVTNRLHHPVKLSDFGQKLIEMVDGEHDRDALVTKLLESFRQGQAQVTHRGKPVTEERRALKVLPEILEEELRGLARAGLLVG